MDNRQVCPSNLNHTASQLFQVGCCRADLRDSRWMETKKPWSLSPVHQKCENVAQTPVRVPLLHLRTSSCLRHTFQTGEESCIIVSNDLASFHHSVTDLSALSKNRILLLQIRQHFIHLLLSPPPLKVAIFVDMKTPSGDEHFSWNILRPLFFFWQRQSGWWGKIMLGVEAVRNRGQNTK